MSRIRHGSVPFKMADEESNPGSWYRLNAEPEIPMTLTKGRNNEHWTRLDFDLPEPLARYDIRANGNHLGDAQVEQIRSMEDDTHSLYLPFTADGKAYSTNLAFSVGVFSYKVLLGAPGHP